MSNVDNVVAKLEKYFSYGMTPFQIENFVINEFQTDYRKLRQIIIEINTRLEQRVGADLDVRQKKIELEQLESYEFTDDFERRLNEIDIERKKVDLESRAKNLRQVDNELDQLRSALEAVVERQGGYDKLVEKLESDDYHMEQERAFWIEKLGKSALGDMVNFGTITKGVYESLILLDDDAREKALQKAVNGQFDALQSLNNAKEQLLIEND